MARPPRPNWVTRYLADRHRPVWYRKPAPLRLPTSPVAVAFLVDLPESNRSSEPSGPLRIESCMAHTQAYAPPTLLADLRRIAPVDPEHLHGEIALIVGLPTQHPDMLQIACFDTAFHRPCPAWRSCCPFRAGWSRGHRHYGFHGLSYTYLLGNLPNWPVPTQRGDGFSRPIWAAERVWRLSETARAWTPRWGLRQRAA